MEEAEAHLEGHIPAVEEGREEEEPLQEEKEQGRQLGAAHASPIVADERSRWRVAAADLGSDNFNDNRITTVVDGDHE